MRGFLCLAASLAIVSGAGAESINGQDIDWGTSARRGLQSTVPQISVVRLDVARMSHASSAVLSRISDDVFVVYTRELDAGSVQQTATFSPRMKYWHELDSSRGVVIGVSKFSSMAVMKRAVVAVVKDARVTVVERSHAHGTLNVNKILVWGNVTRAQVDAIAANDAVVWIDRAPFVQPLTLSYSAETVGLYETPVSLYPATNETVAVFDTGIDTAHCMFTDPLHTVSKILLEGAAETCPDTGHDKVRCLVTVCTAPYPNCYPTDDVDVFGGHGTHTAGTAAGRLCNSSYGLISGAASAARVAFFDLGVGTGSGIYMPADYQGMLQTAYDAGARSFFMSFGSYADGVYDEGCAEIDLFAWNNPDVTIAVSAGNSGASLNPATRNLASPGSAKSVAASAANMISTAAYAAGDRGFSAGDVASYPERYAPSSIASFSAQGPLDDGRVGPLCATQGVRVASAQALGVSPTSVTLMTGTSMMRIPLANVRSRLREIVSVPSSALSRAVLALNARPAARVVEIRTTTAALLSDSPASRAGFGVLDIYPSFWNDLTKWSFHDDVSISSYEVRALCFDAPAGSITTVALAWTDYPGTPLSNRAIVDTLHVRASRYLADGSEILVQSNTNAVDVLRRLSIPAHGTVTKVHVVVSSFYVVHAPLLFAVVAHDESGLVYNATDCTACSTFEVPSPCYVANGNGTSVCGVCSPTSCNAGYAFNAIGVCATTLLTTPCNATHGTGLLDGDECVEVACDADYVYDDEECVCDSGRELVCEDGATVRRCNTATGEYDSSCVETSETSAPTSAPATFVSTATIAGALIVTAIFATLVVIMCAGAIHLHNPVEIVVMIVLVGVFVGFIFVHPADVWFLFLVAAVVVLGYFAWHLWSARYPEANNDRIINAGLSGIMLLACAWTIASAVMWESTSASVAWLVVSIVFTVAFFGAACFFAWSAAFPNGVPKTNKSVTKKRHATTELDAADLSSRLNRALLEAEAGGKTLARRRIAEQNV